MPQVFLGYCIQTLLERKASGALDPDRGKSHSNLFPLPDTILPQEPRVKATEETGSGQVSLLSTHTVAKGHTPSPEPLDHKQLHHSACAGPGKALLPTLYNTGNNLSLRL